MLDHTTDGAPVFANPAGLCDPAPNGYSHLAVTPAGARIVHVAGQVGEDAEGRLSPDFRAQVAQAFANLLVALEAAGSGPRHVAKLTILVVDHTEERLAIFGEELARAFGADVKPAGTLIPVPRLALDGLLFEVDAVAVVA